MLVAAKANSKCDLPYPDSSSSEPSHPDKSTSRRFTTDSVTIALFQGGVEAAARLGREILRISFSEIKEAGVDEHAALPSKGKAHAPDHPAIVSMKATGGDLN